MGKYYYSYCCKKYVEKNSERPDLIDIGVFPPRGYHCSCCNKQLTVYGNPILDSDKEKLKLDNRKLRKDNFIRGSKIECREEGFYLINELYPYGELSDGYEPLIENWVLFDYYANFVACIRVKYVEGYMPIFTAKLTAAKLYAVRMNQFYKYDLNSITDLKQKPEVLKNQLEITGWKFNKNGKLK